MKKLLAFTLIFSSFVLQAMDQKKALAPKSKNVEIGPPSIGWLPSQSQSGLPMYLRMRIEASEVGAASSQLHAHRMSSTSSSAGRSGGIISAKEMVEATNSKINIFLQQADFAGLEQYQAALQSQLFGQPVLVRAAITEQIKQVQQAIDHPDVLILKEIQTTSHMRALELANQLTSKQTDQVIIDGMRHILAQKDGFQEFINRDQFELANEFAQEKEAAAGSAATSTIDKDEKNIIDDTAYFESGPMYDMKITTPTDIDSFKRIVTANPATNYAEYIVQVKEFLSRCEKNIALGTFNVAYFAKEFAEGTAKHLRVAASDPRAYIRGHIEGTMQLMQKFTEFYIEVYSQPDELWVSEQQLAQFEADVQRRMQEMSAEFDQLMQTVAQMSREEWADLTSRVFVDYIIFACAERGIREIGALSERVRSSEVFDRINHQFESFARRNPEMVTSDGTRVQIRDGSGAASALKNETTNSASGSRPRLLQSKKTVEELISKAKPGRITKGPTRQYLREGGFRKALKDFDSLDLKKVRDISDANGIKKIGFLKDGSKVLVRDYSTSGAPTLEVQYSKNKIIKFRY